MKTLNWDRIREILKSRRFSRDMKRKGYRMHETDWDILRGGDYRKVIVDAVIDVGGKHVWTKIGDKEAS